jgi:hypothetical protein
MPDYPAMADNQGLVKIKFLELCLKPFNPVDEISAAFSFGEAEACRIINPAPDTCRIISLDLGELHSFPETEINLPQIFDKADLHVKIQQPSRLPASAHGTAENPLKALSCQHLPQGQDLLNPGGA